MKANVSKAHRGACRHDSYCFLEIYYSKTPFSIVQTICNYSRNPTRYYTERVDIMNVYISVFL